ncbi:MAG: hypothetical protein HY057_08260, partial [Rhodospirillales bacterium]|nr:hypothetical protein [Rhodospirillales bacterium]
LAIDDEAMPVILGLIDRLYETRRRLRAILLAVADLPEKWRDTVLRRLSEDISPEDRG